MRIQKTSSLTQSRCNAGRVAWLGLGLLVGFLWANSQTSAQGQSPAPALPPALKEAGPRARVVVVHDANATEAFQPTPDRIFSMVTQGITNLTGKDTLEAGWLSLVTTQDVVGIKVFSAPGPNSGTRPAVVEAVVRGLIKAGVPARNVIIWDKQMTELRLAGFVDLAQRYGARSLASIGAGYDEKIFYENPLLGNLVWSDLEFERKGAGIGRKSFVSKLLTQQVTRLINVTPMLNHNEAGVSGNLYSLASAGVDNFARFDGSAERMAIAVPEIYANTNLFDRVALNIVDALICQYEGSERGLLHYSTTMNEIRFSKDPVALDVLSLRDLEKQRKWAQAPTVKTNTDLYSNAALLELGVSDLKRVQVDTVECK